MQNNQHVCKITPRATKWSQKSTQRHQTGAERAPKASKMDTKGSQRYQNGAKRPPKATQMEPKMSPGDLKMTHCGQVSEFNGFGMDLGSHFDLFWEQNPLKNTSKIDAQIDAEKT